MAVFPTRSRFTEIAAGVCWFVMAMLLVAGVAASGAAGREGKSVVLVEPLELVGGMMSGGLGFSDSNQTARETLGGLFEEFHLRVEKHYADHGIKLPYEVRVKDNKPWIYEPH